MDYSKIKSEVFFQTKEKPWEDAAEGIKRQMIGYDINIMMVKVDFQKGAIGQIHDHFHSQTTYVESGSFEVTIGEEKKVLNTGDGFFIPPNVPHGAICLEAGVLIDVFSPIREDFLDISFTKK